MAAGHLRERAAIAVELLLYADDTLLVERLDAVAGHTGLPLVAAGDVLMHLRSRKPVQDTLTAIRLKTPLADCGFALARNAEQHLRSRAAPGAAVPRRRGCRPACASPRAARSRSSELRYEYPAELVPEGQHADRAPARAHRASARASATRKACRPRVQAQIEKELALIEELRYEAFFLTVHDIVRFARSQGILCQGRGSAANSAVCYCLGITEVDPMHTTLLFERFISRERNEPPDIDVDFEHERREEVIQYIYAKYGRERAALAAALSHLPHARRGARRRQGARPRRAADRRAGALGALVRRRRAPAARPGRSRPRRRARRSRSAGWSWSTTLKGFPRHLSQHVGGFVIAADKLSRLVPIENAAMDDRRVIQWDKDDLESLGLLKVDVLALGMLTLHPPRARLDDRLARPALAHAGHPAARTPRVYDMVCRADTVGVFQIESRAQMSMLPRLKPRTLYDLVIEVAIVRPGPIQGGMVHPYLKRRDEAAAAAARSRRATRRSTPRSAARWACRSSRSR